MHSHDIPYASHAALVERLDAGQRYASEFQGGLSNHLPMALIALARLGASADRLLQFEAGYAPRLERRLIGGPPAAEPGQWRQRLGDLHAEGVVRAQLEAELSRNGADAVLRGALPHLLPGVGAAAFHGLIRTAYAVEVGHLAELAAGLAYWACRYLPLGAKATEPGSLGVPDWADRLLAGFAGFKPDRGLIFDRMRDASLAQGFSQAVADLAVGPSTLEALSRWAVERYQLTQDFTVLHLITSAHALRLLLPWVPEPLEAIGWYAQAFAAGLVGSGRGAGTRPDATAAASSWDDVIAWALMSDDDHVIKLVYTCREEAAHRGDAGYRAVASLAATP